MDGLNVDVLGTRTIVDNLDALSDELRAKVLAIMQDAAAVGEQVMKENARVDTGEMRDKTYTEVRDEGDQLQLVAGDDSDHAIFNELGTSKMSAQPFILPGGMAAGDYIKEHTQGIL